MPALIDYLIQFGGMSPARLIVSKYAQEHPDIKDGVLKAFYAYHAPHFRCMLDLPLHNFTNGARYSECVWCGRSREQMRHDELPAQCALRPMIQETKDVVREEEQRAMALAEHAQKDVRKLVAKMGMSGETLAVLYHTYGHDPETVASVIDVRPQVLADYHAVMEIEKTCSRAAQKKIVR